MTRRAVIRIPVEMLGGLIQLPEEMEILHATIGNYGMAFDLVVTAPDMAETHTEIGAVPPTLNPLYEVVGSALRVVDVDYPRTSDAATEAKAS